MQQNTSQVLNHVINVLKHASNMLNNANNIEGIGKGPRAGIKIRNARNAMR